MLNKNDLVGLGITPGPLFSKVFKAVKAAKTKEEALAIAVAIRDGTLEKKERIVKKIDPDSVLVWAIESRDCFPALEQTTGVDNSMSAVRRMFEQQTMTLNGVKPKPDDMMEFPIWELVFFKGSKRQHTIFFDLDAAPLGFKWMTFIREKHKNDRGGDDLSVVVGERWHTKT